MLQKHGVVALMILISGIKVFVPRPQVILETERILVTRHRKGSHSLSIELGRYNNIPRLERLCCCGTNIQNLWHVFSECPLTIPLIDTPYQDLQSISLDEKVHQHLLIITKKLIISIGMM